MKLGTHMHGQLHKETEYSSGHKGVCMELTPLKLLEKSDVFTYTPYCRAAI